MGKMVESGEKGVMVLRGWKMKRGKEWKGNREGGVL